MISPAKIYSVLGNPKSLVPLGVKDGANCVGLTAASYVTGKKEEAQDRFIDEVGTEAIWLGAIPAFKKGIDLTLFKLFKFDPKCDIRNLENKEILQKSIEKAPTESIKNSLKYIQENAKKFKALNFVKIIAATGLALASYDILTDMKQKYTDKKLETKIKKQMDKEHQNAIMQNKTFVKIKNTPDTTIFSSLKKHNNISFKGGMTDFILNPVKNMYILDAGITGQRLAKSRDSQELVGYGIREGGFLFFMYYLGQKIQNHMENRADKKFNKSIALDSKVLEDDTLKKLFETGEIENSINAFPEYATVGEEPKGILRKIKNFFNPTAKTPIELSKDTELFEYIHNNPDNAVVQTAKKSDIIQNYKIKQEGFLGFFKKKIDTGKIDTRKYIDMDEMRKTHGYIKKLYAQFKASGEDIETFFNGVRKLKRNAVKTNMAASMLALGVVLPSLMLGKRILTNDKEFATEKRIRERLQSDNNNTK